MAPMAFGDKLNLYSMIGTWLGTLFTLIGLVAVIAQLRTLLKGFAGSSNEIARAAAGDWAVCLPKLRRSDTGIIEGNPPSLRAWIQYYYKEEKSIAVCPYERKSMSGRSSWSRLFCRLQILPEEFMNLGSWDSRDGATKPYTQAHMTADILVDGSKISYGLSGDEFAALLILSGFSPSKFDRKETTQTTSHLGFMYLASHSGDPFSQVAQLDEMFWNCFNTSAYDGGKWEGRYADRVNVRHCIDLALGIFRFDCVRKPAMLVFGSHGGTKIWQSAKNWRWDLLVPNERQVLSVRRNLTALTGGSMEQDLLLYDIKRIAFPDFCGIFGRVRFASKQQTPEFGLVAPLLNSVFEIAFSLKALKPWGLLPVMPHSIVRAFCPLLKDLVDKSKQLRITASESIILVERFKALPIAIRHNVPRRTRAMMDAGLDSLANIEEAGSFSGLSARCSLYYDAMIFLFQNHNLKLEDVETGLAVRCAVNFVDNLADSSGLYQKAVLCKLLCGNRAGEVSALQCQEELGMWLRECLDGKQGGRSEKWAEEVLALYIYAWLNEAKDITDDFRENFRRRVFLG